MSRVALLATAAAVFLLAVSFGVAQSPVSPQPRPTIPVPAGQTPVPPTLFPQGFAPPGPQLPASPHPTQMPSVAVAPYIPGPAAPAEKMTVKVYSVPDLVATVQSQQKPPQSLAAHPELAQVIQQVQLQVQAAMPADPSEEVSKKLERLKKAIRVAAPKKSWEDGGGDGEIEVYPEALCLIVRQTSAGHEAIADLLTQLRATQDVQIELTVELLSLEGIADEHTAQAIRFLNKELSPEELTEFRNCGVKTAASSVVRMANGHSANAGLFPGVSFQFTAVASADRSIVQFRTEVNAPIDADSAAALVQAWSQSRSVTVGKTLAVMIDPDGSTVMQVTPKVVDRKPATAK